MSNNQSNQDFSEFQERGGDIVGIWAANPTTPNPIHFIPQDVVMGDSKNFDKTKPSILIFGKLCSPCLLLAKSDEDNEDADPEVVEGKPGDLVGIWYKPGMAAIRNLGGVEVLLDFKRDEKGIGQEKDVNKGNPMKLYSVKSKTPGGKLQVRADRREKSKNTATFLDDAPGVSASKPGAIPF